MHGKTVKKNLKKIQECLQVVFHNVWNIVGYTI